MSDSITTFFDAWELENSDERRKKIAASVMEGVQYDDPRTPDTVNGIDALNDYVGMFSKNAPGWSAKVIAIDTTAGMDRATVTFAGAGPDGDEIVQFGQYFVEKEDGLISRMVGFTGAGIKE